MFLYRAISIILFPLFILYIFWRALNKKENFKRIGERFAITPAKLLQDLIWIHAVSVGETNSALILVDEILKSSPKTNILFTTTTLTSAAILAGKIENFHGRVIHQFLPIDSYFVVKKFLNYWRPQKIFFVESEIWPNFIYQAAKLEIPTFLVNARISQKSFSRWLILKNLGFNIFDYFKIIFAQSEEIQQKFSQLTKNKVLFFGNLKSQALNLEFNETELLKLKSEIGPRKYWLAASTHKGEEEIIISIHKKLKEKFSDILTIIVPRHPHRASEIIDLMNNIKFAQRSIKQPIKNDVEIYLADALGELGLFYRLANFTFLGASLVKLGGHNPFEPIKLNCAVISGENVFNFQEIYAQLDKEKACEIVSNEEELLQKVELFLQDHNACEALASKALHVINEFGKNNNIARKIFVTVSDAPIYE